MSSLFPLEILYEIALHLPLTEDVISFSLTSHAVRAALSTPVLFKARLVLQRWDIDAWEDEDDKAQRSVDWKRWIRIDYIHSKTSQLLEEASAGGLSPQPAEREPSSPNPNVLLIRNTRIHVGKAEIWSRRMCKVFPMVIAHHRLNNILHITKTKYCGAFRAYLRVVMAIYSHSQRHQIRDFHGLSTVGILERACFGLAAFVMQCKAKTIESVFGDAWTVDGSPDFVAVPFKTLRILAMGLFSQTSHFTALLDIVDTSMRYIAGFLIQIKMRLWLHFQSVRSTLSLLPPSMPPMNPASQHDGPFELGSTTISESRPWLRDGLAGTPLGGPSSASGRRWAGYYTYSGVQERHDPPMFFKLYLVPPPAEDEAGYKVYFSGEGADAVGQFTLEGSSNTKTGAVVARKTYVGAHWWDWYGVITPFGMVGVWGTCTDIHDTHGWWWVWPREWSESRTDSVATVTQ